MVLSLDLNSVLIPKSISECLQDVSRIEDGPKKYSKIEYYVKELEDEIRKFDAFKRELPLCMLLLNDAVLRLKQGVMNNKERKDEAVVDDFVPSKLSSCEDKVVDLKNERDLSDKKSWSFGAITTILIVRNKSLCQSRNREVKKTMIDPRAFSQKSVMKKVNSEIR